MIPSLLLLSATLLADPVIISEVKAVREAGHLRVEVIGDGGIDPEGARTVIDEGRLLIYLGGTRVKADNRAWDLEDGAGEIRAHRHRTETELVVPLAGNGCTGPVELAGSNTGITALVGCDGAVPTPRPARVVVTARAAAPVRAVAPAHAAAGPKTATPVLTDQEKLKALVGLDPIPAAAREAVRTRAAVEGPDNAVSARTEKTEKAEKAEKAEIGKIALASEPTSAPSKSAPAAATAAAAEGVVAPVVVPIAELPRVSAPTATPTPTTTPSSGAAASAPAVAPPRVESSAVAARAVAARAVVSPILPGSAPAAAGPIRSSPGSLGTVALPALLLAALAVAAYLFVRRRRVLLPRHIQILETTTLGPKRSLIVARVGDQTLILGSSEAGITLLKDATPAATGDTATAARRGPEPATTPAASASAVDAAMAGWARVDEQAAIDSKNELSQPIQEALADIPEPDHGRSAAVRSGFRAIEGGLGGAFGRRGGESDIRSESSDRFEDVLEDSIEDQELRRKLAAGMSSRVR